MASAANAGSDTSPRIHSMPLGAPPSGCVFPRRTCRTRFPRASSFSASTVPTCPAPSTTWSSFMGLILMLARTPRKAEACKLRLRYCKAMDRLRWDDMPLFLALFRERNLLGAGRRLGLDASTASRRLASLEEATGARLFDRTRQGLAPTEAAEQMLPPAEEMERASVKLAHAAQ